MKMTPDTLDEFRPLLDLLGDGVCVADQDGRMLYANAAVGQLLGVDHRQAQEGKICDLLCARLAGVKCDQCPVKIPEGQVDAITYDGRLGEGGEQAPYVRVRCLRVRRPRGERHFIIVEDARESALARQRREEWRDMFAHDLRSPLTNVLGVLRMVEEKGAGHPILERDLDMIHLAVRSCERITDLLDSYLTVSRLGSGHMKVHATAIDASALIESCVLEEAAKARSLGRSLECSTPPGLMALADSNLLHRVIVNLVDNALKFTMTGGEVRVLASGVEGSVLVRVEDDGAGISPEDLPKVFERFYQGSGPARGVGFGLGLTFCREAMKAMNGEVTAESELGRGSAFTLRLPAAPGGTP